MTFQDEGPTAKHLPEVFNMVLKLSESEPPPTNSLNCLVVFRGAGIAGAGAGGLQIISIVASHGTPISGRDMGCLCITISIAPNA